MAKVLITGASGLIGKRLTGLLLKKGYEVNVLGRTQNRESRTKADTFVWNVERGELDEDALEGASAIIHLAGANIAEKRWTKERKNEIIESRTKSAQLIFNSLKKNNHEVKTFISASAVGYYGDCGDEILTEDHKPGSDYLAEVCKQWEKSVIQFSKLKIREVRCRIGIVLAKNGGALPELTKTLPVGVASYFSKPNLYYPWIHLDDVCGVIAHALENENMLGAYNTCAPEPLLMKSLMQEILFAKKSKAVLIPAPPLAIKLSLGEMSSLVLSSQRCSAEKILASGYKFKFKEIGRALKDVLE